MLKSLKDKKLFAAWDIIDNEMTELNLKDVGYVDELKEQRNFQLMELEQLLNPTALNNIFLQEKKAEIEANKKDSKPFDFYGVLAAMSKFVGFQINSKVLTVVEYYANVTLMKQSIKTPVKNGN